MMKLSIFNFQFSILLALLLISAPDLSAQVARPVRARLAKEEHTHKGAVRVKLSEKAAARLEAQIEKQPVAARQQGMLRTSAPGQTLNTGTSKLNKKLQGVKAQKMRRVFPRHPRYEARQRAAGLHLWYEVEIDSTLNPVNVSIDLIDDDIIEAEPVLRKINIEALGKKQTPRPVKPLPVNERVLPVSVVTRNNTPLMLAGEAQATPFAAAAGNYEDHPPVNDPYLLLQWHYYNYGQVTEPSMGGASDPNASIHLFDAWKITMGDPRVIVSVHDHGIDYDHPDLLDNMWVNWAEYRGDPGVDDDGNGFIDDVYGYNFFIMGDINPGSHGTHVAGTIAAATNNGIGVAGIAGGSGNKDGVRVMSCQILDDEGADSGDGAAVSYVYAANNGAVISQNSWAYTIAGEYEQALLDAIDYFVAWAGRDENGDPLPNTPMVGGLVICAAGNDGLTEKFYPAAHDPCISVCATGPWNEQPGYTNIGSWIDIAAPGGDTNIGDNPPFASSGVLSCNNSRAGTLYGFMQGTSMATPHVSGVAALVLSAYGNDAYTPGMLRHRLLSTVSTWDELGIPKHIGRLGAGLLNAAKALHPDEGTPPARITDLAVEAESFDYATLRFTAPSDPDNRDAHVYEIRYATENITPENLSAAKALFQLAQPAGTPESVTIDHLQGETVYYVAIRAADIWGNVSALSNVVTVTTGQAPVIEITPAVDTIRIVVADAVANPVGNASFTVKNKQGGDLRYAHNYAVADMPIWNDNFKLMANINPEQGFSAAFGEDGSARFLAATKFTVAETFTLTHLQAGIIPRGLSTNASEAYYGEDFNIKVYKGGKTPADGELISEFATFIPPRLYYFAYGADLIFTLAEAYRFAKGDVFWIVFDFPEGYLQPVTVNVATASKVTDELYSSDAKTWHQLNKLDIGGLPHNYAFRIFALDNMPALLDGLIAITPESGTLPAGQSETISLSAGAGKLPEGAYKGTIFTESNDPVTRIVHQPFVLTVDGQHKGFRTVRSLSMGSCVQGFTLKKSITVHNDSLGILRIGTVTSSERHFTVTPAANVVVNPGDSAVFDITFHAPKAVAGDTQPADSTGTLFARITFESNAITPVYAVTVDAISIERPVAELSETEAHIALHLTEQKDVAFTLRNAGKYRLDYTAGSDRVSSYDYAGVDPADTRYYAERDNAPERFTSIASSDNDVSKQLSGTKRTFVPLKFSFDAYGVKYDTLTLLGDGRIVLGQRTGSLRGPRVGFLDSDPAVIYPIYNGNAILTDFKDDASGAGGGHVYVQADADKVIIEYSKVGYTIVRNSEISIDPDASQTVVTDHISVQTTLYADGRIEFAYQDYTKGATELNAMIGMSDATGEGGLGIYFLQPNHLQPGKFYADSRPLSGFSEGAYITERDGKKDTLYWVDYPPFLQYGDNVRLSVFPNQSVTKDIHPAGGVLLPGEEQEITLTLQVAQDMREGTYERIFPIYTNDPLNDTLYFKVTIDYTSEPVPVLDTNLLDFGPVGRDVPVTKRVSLRNTGGKAFNITSVDGTGGSAVFGITSSGTVCAPFSAVGFDVTFTPTKNIDYTHTIVIRTDAGNFTLRMTGTGTVRPLMEMQDNDVWNITLTLAEETAKDSSIIVRNTGDAPLEYTILANDWIKYRPDDAQEPARHDYFWTDNKNSKGTLYQWIWKDPKPFEPVDLFDNARFDRDFRLPWEFEFYGEKYDHCYVNASGMIYFEKGDVLYSMTLNTVAAGNTIIPAKDDGVNGFIAPLTGAYDLFKCYYEQVGEGDAAQMVFTWDVAALGGSPGRMLFQAILSADGSIKFQYKDVEKALWRNRTTIGIENRAGDDGLSIAYMDGDYITNGLAIMITPGVKRTLPPPVAPATGTSDTLHFTIDAAGLWDVGEPYRGEVRILSNDRLHPEAVTRVNLTVRGEVKLEYYINGEQTKVIDYGEVLRYEYPMSVRFIPSHNKYQYETEVPHYYRDITIKNAGTKVHTLRRMNALENFILRDIISNPGGVGTQSLTIEPGDETTLRVEFIPINDNNVSYDLSPPLGAGSYDTVYVITGNSCEYLFAQHEVNPCVPSEYPFSEPITVAGGFEDIVVGTRYYATDTLHVTAFLRDIPNQTFESPCTIIDTTFDDYSGVKEFAFSLHNPVLERAYWRRFFGLNEKVPIDDQSELHYTIVATEITEEEFFQQSAVGSQQLAVGSQQSAVSSRQSAITVGSSSIYCRLKTATANWKLSTTAAPLTAAAAAPAAAEPETFIDSLGYFNYLGAIDAYYVDIDPADRLINYIRFKTADTPFNLTHISMLALNFGRRPEQGYDVVIRIYLGEELEGARKVYETTINSGLEDMEEGTIYHVMFNLSRGIYVEPGQHVWIGIENTCNTGVMSLAYDDYNSIRDNFMIEGTGSSSFRDYNYNVLGSQSREGWGIFAWSGALSDGNAPWITLSRSAGTLTPGQSADIAVRLEPGKGGVELPNYYARIESKSNDPYPYGRDTIIRSPDYFYNSTSEMAIPTNPGRNFNDYQKDPARILVRIHVNQGPQIIVPNPARMAEATDTTFLIKLIDEEGDGVKDFSLTYVSKTVEDGDENVEPEVLLGGSYTSGDTVIYPVAVHADYMATGRYAYELRATDHKNIQSILRWNIMVSRTYRKPAIVDLPDVEVEVDHSLAIDLRKAIIDYNNSPVAYTATVRHPNTAAIMLVNDVLTIFGITPNTTDIRVKARNTVGQVDTFFNVTVTPLRPVGSLPPVAMAVGESRTVDLDRHFSDPAERGALSYTATSASANVAAVHLGTPTILTINALSTGTAEVTVTAQSAQSTTVSVPFTVSVIDKAQGSNMVIYPNPVTTALNLVLHVGEPQEVEVRIFSSSGALVYRHNYGMVSEWHTPQINVSSLPAGIYIVQYMANGKEVAKKRFVK